MGAPLPLPVEVTVAPELLVRMVEAQPAAMAAAAISAAVMPTRSMRGDAAADEMDSCLIGCDSWIRAIGPQ